MVATDIRCNSGEIVGESLSNLPLIFNNAILMFVFKEYWISIFCFVVQEKSTLGARDFSCGASGFGQVLSELQNEVHSTNRKVKNRVIIQNIQRKTCRPAADQALLHTREKISGTQGRKSRNVSKKSCGLDFISSDSFFTSMQ